MKNLKKRKLYLQVYDELREFIKENKLQPGDRLPTEMEMCSLLGVSRNVLREAVKTLEITGVVRSTPGVGIIIQKFSPDYLFSNLFLHLVDNSDEFLFQTMEVRRALELNFAGQAYDSLTKQSFDEMCEQVLFMESTLESILAKGIEKAAFGENFREADAGFHKALFRDVNNTILHAILDAVWACDTFHVPLYPIDYVSRTVKRHRMIVTAYAQSDFDAFLKAMNQHFDAFKPTPAGRP